MLQFPVSFQWGGITVTLHAILEFLAYFVGFRLYLFLRKKQGDRIVDANRIWIIIGAIAGALVGSRLVGGFESWQNLSTTNNLFLHFFGNKSIVGGLLGGLFGVELTKLMIGEKQKSGDLFVVPIIIALMVGRVGCFSMGVYEDVTGYPTTFMAGMDLGDGIKRHPLMLYEIFFLAILLSVFMLYQKRIDLSAGSWFKIFMISYLCFRFFIEFLKPHESYIARLGAIQIACFSGLLYYAKYIFNPKLLSNGLSTGQKSNVSTI